MRTDREILLLPGPRVASIVSYFCLFRLPLWSLLLLFFFLQDARELIISYLVLATRRRRRWRRRQALFFFLTVSPFFSREGKRQRRDPSLSSTLLLSHTAVPPTAVCSSSISRTVRMFVLSTSSFPFSLLLHDSIFDRSLCDCLSYFAACHTFPLHELHALNRELIGHASYSVSVISLTHDNQQRVKEHCVIASFAIPTCSGTWYVRDTPWSRCSTQ